MHHSACGPGQGLLGTPVICFVLLNAVIPSSPRLKVQRTLRPVTAIILPLTCMEEPPYSRNPALPPTKVSLSVTG